VPGVGFLVIDSIKILLSQTSTPYPTRLAINISLKIGSDVRLTSTERYRERNPFGVEMSIIPQLKDRKQGFGERPHSRDLMIVPAWRGVWS